MEERAYLERFSALIERGKTVLDVGCGDGLPVDAYLVEQGFAVNGIDRSLRLIEAARRNVPEGFFEVKDLADLHDGEYCVDGVVSLRAVLHLPPDHYRALLETFASFMPKGGGLLLAVRSEEWSQAPDAAHAGSATSRGEGASDATELLEHAGFSVILHDIHGRGEEQHHIIIASS